MPVAKQRCGLCIHFRADTMLRAGSSPGYGGCTVWLRRVHVSNKAPDECITPPYLEVTERHSG